jgi:hypothetical protein
MTIKLWQLGLVAVVALLAAAAFAGYLLAPKPAAADSSVFARQLAEKTALITSLLAQLSARQPLPALVSGPASVRPAGAPPGTPPLASKDRAAESAAVETLRVVLPDVASYNVDNVAGAPPKTDPDFATSGTDSGYAGMTVAGLRRLYDEAIPAGVWVSPSEPGFPQGVTGVTPTATTYCAVSRSGAWYGWRLGPSGLLRASQSPRAVCKS